MRPAQQSEPEQLTLELPHLAALGAEDFLVSTSNEAAVALVEGWPHWPRPAIGIVGPEGTGKTHLVNVWRSRSGAESVAAAGISEGTLALFDKTRVLAVENIDQGIADERILFHLLNLAREKSGSLLLTSRVAPGDIAISLPDLRSRLRALPLAAIAEPDEALLKSVLVKLFADRQLGVEPHVVNHLALHMERSMEAANRVVAAADRLALARQRKVTRVIASEALAEVAAGREP